MTTTRYLALYRVWGRSMASITPIEIQQTQSGGRGLINTWETLTAGDDGEPVLRIEFVDRSVQVIGTFGGATILIQGSNDGVNYYTLNDLQGNALTFSVAGLKGVAEPTKYIKPVVSGGATVDIDVILFGKQV